MSPDAYCQAQAAARGASLHYATVFLPALPRRALLALGAYAREVESVVSHAGDPAVAQAKLLWWRAELERIDTGQASHPIAQALAALAPVLPAITLARLDAVLTRAEAGLHQTRFLDYAGLSHFHAAGDRALAEVASGVLGGDAAAAAAAERLAHALRLVGLISDTGAAVRRGQIWLPLDDLRCFDVKASELAGGRDYPAGWVALMQLQAGRARAAWSQAIHALPASARRSHRPLLILGQIAMRQLDEIEAEDFKILHQRVALTPITRLWLAWRTGLFGPRRT